MTLAVYTGLYQAESLIRFQQNGSSNDSKTKTPFTATETKTPVVFSSTPPSPLATTRLVGENQEPTDSGFRRTRIFEQPDGRQFIKVETLSLTATGAERTIVQQNPSGSITRYDDILDRQADGAFRRTQRFSDESGQTQTQITPNVQVTDPFVLFGGGILQTENPPSPFIPLRGTQLDLIA
jgi:hypothetical protein